MEQKTNPGQQAEPQEAPQSTPWIDKVKELADTIGKELDETQGRRGFLLVAVDGTPFEEGKPTVTLGAISGHSIALGIAVKHVLTAPPFAKHIAAAAKLMAIDAATSGKGTLVVDLSGGDEDDQAGDDNQEQEQSQEGEADGE